MQPQQYEVLKDRSKLTCAQVQEYRYNVKFADDFASVSYTNHNFQSFAPNDSCATCLLSDTFVGINRWATHCDRMSINLSWTADAWSQPSADCHGSPEGMLHAGRIWQSLQATGARRQPC